MSVSLQPETVEPAPVPVTESQDNKVVVVVDANDGMQSSKPEQLPTTTSEAEAESAEPVAEVHEEEVFVSPAKDAADETAATTQQAAPVPPIPPPQSKMEKRLVSDAEMRGIDKGALTRRMSMSDELKSHVENRAHRMLDDREEEVSSREQAADKREKELDAKKLKVLIHMIVS